MPAGVPISGLDTPDATVKQPLPHDFTKTIKCTRNPVDPLPNLPETINNTNVVQKPEEETPLNMYKFVNTSNGSFLVPLDIVITDNNTKTEPEVNTKVTDSTGTVTTPAEVNSKPKMLPQPNLVRYNTEDHCSCCLLLRKIAKKQTVITDYFRKDKVSRKCYCSEVKYPKVTNKLRMLANNFKNHSGLVFDEMNRRLENIKSGNVRRETDGLGKCTLDELGKLNTFTHTPLTFTRVLLL